MQSVRATETAPELRADPRTRESAHWRATEDSWRGVRLFTIGHSTRTLDELVVLLRARDVSVLADVRTIPRSRHNPQFDSDALSSSLRARGIRYVHLRRLGGLRRARRDSPNGAWRNESFRGYADYTSTDEFEAGLAELFALTSKDRVAIMCAEAVPWRCHRSIVADVLVARGAHVEHITSRSSSTSHRMTPFARVRRGRVTYPGDDAADDGGRLATRAPFHLEATVRVLQRRPTNLVDVWDRDRFMRVLGPPEDRTLVEVVNQGTIDAPDVRYFIREGAASSLARARLAPMLRRVLGLDVDPALLARCGDAFPTLRPTVLALRGMRPPRFTSLFETFGNVVPFQQVSLDAGAAVVRKLVEHFGESVEHAGRRFHSFPTSRRVAEARLDALRRCGLSTRKADALRSLARAIESSAVTEESLSSLSTSDALRTLDALPGIGPWSASLVMLRGFGRLDVFPPNDAGAQRGLGALLQVGTKTPLADLVERAGDHRGYLYFCALGDSLLAKRLIHAAEAAGESLRPVAPRDSPTSRAGRRPKV